MWKGDTAQAVSPDGEAARRGLVRGREAMA
jgi:hypothetical protein